MKLGGSRKPTDLYAEHYVSSPAAASRAARQLALPVSASVLKRTCDQLGMALALSRGMRRVRHLDQVRTLRDPQRKMR